MTRNPQYKLTLHPKVRDMLDNMMKDQAFLSIAEAIVHCIRTTDMIYKSGNMQPSKVNGAKSDPKNKKQSKQILLCTKLEGQISPDGTTCTYYKYDEKLRFEQVIPISMLEQVMVDNQYTPSRERVLKLQELGKTKY